VSQVLLARIEPVGRPFLGEVAVVGLARERDVEPVVVERLARVEVDRAGEAAFDHVGGGVLVDIDRAEQFGRHVGEVQRLPADAGGERVAAVEFRRTKLRPRMTTPEPSTEKWSGRWCRRSG
jgi:hypothetical protein